jgi:uncharacterized membrane protein
MNKNRENIKRLVGISLFSAMVVVLQLISNYVTFGPVSITLALTPVIVGSIIYGPKAGFILGAIQGFLIYLAPSTQGLFVPYSAISTFFVCILKTGLAGLASGYIYKVFKKSKFGVIFASISVPIINTGLFTLASFTVFLPLIKSLATDNATNIYKFVFIMMIGANFIVEFIVNSALSPVVIRIRDIYLNKESK